MSPLIVQADMLQDCRELSPQPGDVHNCMDNFLDILDENISELEVFITQELSASDGGGTAASTAFERSQTAFREYRRENCLWYLEFSAPREWGEQIAKNCLAEMSQNRLTELQSLVTENISDNQLTGYYVFGSDRNSIQVCGDENRYWVEGETALLSQLQQDYLALTTADLEVAYMKAVGRVDTASGSPYPGHTGVVRIEKVLELRGPRDGDCLIAIDPPDKPAIQVSEPDSVPAIESPVVIEAEDEAASPVQQVEPEQQLRAYFGAWRADCEQLGSSYACVLSTPLEGAELEGDSRPQLSLTRRTRKRTIVDLEFPGQEIDSVSRIEWSVDKFDLGTVAESRIRVDQTSARQELRTRPFIQEVLLPLLTGGYDLRIAVREESGSLSTYEATLVGLSRALAFADDFSAADGSF